MIFKEQCNIILFNFTSTFYSTYVIRNDETEKSVANKYATIKSSWMCKLLYFLLTQKHSHGRIDAVPLFPITKIFKSVSGTSPSKGSLYFLNVFWTTSEIFPDGQLNRNNLSYFARPPILDTEENEIKPESESEWTNSK